ncbi:MAG: hypothetical protein LBG21_00370 [Campylobacteraceae bacterium]|jgi:UDP:flavonoid glycosyltransferase YjiC (YdhE family)|nr:hypothetical protein [Campylobacteraceae bacterium]
MRNETQIARQKSVKLLFATIFQDAGEATRALEIAKSLMRHKPQNLDVKIIFLSRGSKFESEAAKSGFEIYKAKPQLSGVGLHQDMKMKPGELIGDPKLALEILKGEIEAYKDINPDFVIHGFWPIGGIARRMLEKTIPGICFVPLPLTESFLDTIQDMPEQMKLSKILLFKLRNKIIRRIPKIIKLRLPLLRHSYIRKAAQKLGWKKEPLINIFSMLRPDLLLVNDLYEYYAPHKFPDTVRFTGPLFADTDLNAAVAPAICDVFKPKNDKLKIFCTLGSSGTKEQLLEVVKVFTQGAGTQWNAVILSPKSVCPVWEALAVAKNKEGIYITDAFVPAKIINQMADITICHGGQGTVQTALYSGTPIVGIATQPEQQMNLDHIASYNAGIRIPVKQWSAQKIQEAVKLIASNAQYKNNAAKLMAKIKEIDGKQECAKMIWEFISQRI